MKNLKLSYLSWKYWHAPMILVKAFAILTAYDMYVECCEGNLDPDWKVENQDIMSLHDFHQELSGQMLHYHPSRHLYSGDCNIRAATSQNKERRKRSSPSVVVHASRSIGDGDSVVGPDESDEEMPALGKDGKLTFKQLMVGYRRQNNNTNPSHLCGNLDLLEILVVKGRQEVTTGV